MKPTVGRMVHFVSEENAEHLPAIVVAVNKEDDKRGRWTANTLNMQIMTNTPGGGTLYRQGVREGTTDKKGSWHWPERDE